MEKWDKRRNKTAHSQHKLLRNLWHFNICASLNFMAFFNLVEFSILNKKLWQNLRRFDTHGKTNLQSSEICDIFR